MKPKQLVDDERVWRELVDRYHDYFAGGMGAEAVKDLVSRLDLAEVEEAILKETIATAEGPAQGEGDQAAQGRSRRSTAATTTAARSTRRWA